MEFRVAVDIGGTFTDLCSLDAVSGQMTLTKSPTTPRNPIDGVMNCVTKAGIDLHEVNQFVHGTTVGINAIKQRSLEGQVALVTTKGFRDVLEIMRTNRPLAGLYNIQWQKPIPLIPRRHRLEVTERVNARGEVIRNLDKKESEKISRQLRREGVISVAVCFLHSYANDRNEEEFRGVLKRAYPQAYISLSSEVNPQVREYERTSTVVIDAYLKPVADRYFTALENGLSEGGLSAPLMVMRCSGGVMTAKTAKTYPVHMIESGPAGGVLGSQFLGKILGLENLIAIDMGGTTFKVGVVDRGAPRHASGGEVEWGVPYRAPVIDLSEIPAGGGSIAWVDNGGILRVGPESAGAEPGPASYGKGANNPTITDANVVLGRLNPDYFLGGEMKLDAEAAEEAVRMKIAQPLGLDTVEAAAGIILVANSVMLESMRVGSVERGYDPRDFATICYGGAGPVVGGILARDLGCSQLIVPPYPGIFSAIGMLAADIRFDSLRSYMSPTNRIDLDRLNKIYKEMETAAFAQLQDQGFKGTPTFMRTADLRYEEQNYEVETPVPGGELTEDDLKTIIENFHKEHRKLYSHAKTDEPTELVAVRLAAIGATPKPELPRVSTGHDESIARKNDRNVYFEDLKKFILCQIYERSKLAAGIRITGPAVIEEVSSTFVLYPNQTATVMENGTIIVKLP